MSVPRPRLTSAEWRSTAGEGASAVVAFAAVGGLGADNGGYFATTWGWAAVMLCCVGVFAAAVVRRAALRRVEKLLLLSVGALTVWTFVSSFWSISVTRSMLEGERSLVYVSAAAAAIMLSRWMGGRAVVVGTWAGITAVCTYALLTRLFPVQFGVFDPLSGSRLSTPVGYSNGLGLFAVLGVLLALGLAARGGAFLRSAGAASGVVLLLVLYFTFARGAWVALFAGLVAAVAVDRRRFQLVAAALGFAVCPAVAVYYASRSEALTHIDVTLAAAQRDGHAVAVLSLFLITFAAVGALVFDTLGERRRFGLTKRVRYLIVAAAAAVVVAVLAVVLARYGTPGHIANEAWRSFSRPSGATSPNLNDRLSTLAGTGRIDNWNVALREMRAHPWLGAGAGTYGEYWFQFRPTPLIVHDAHNLYVETLGELGPLGLALVVCVLAALLAASARSRSPLAAFAFGAAVAYALHAAVDWDWELPCLFLAALLPGIAVVDAPPLTSRPAVRWRVIAVGALSVLGAFALLALLGNIELSRTINASDATQWRRAETAARSALDLAPWSAEPLRALAVAQGGLGQIDAARENLRQAVTMEPRDWSLWYQLAEVSVGGVRRRAFAQAERLNPKRTSGEAVLGDLRLVTIP